MNKLIPDIARQAIIDKLILIGNITGGIGSYSAFFKRVYPESEFILYNRGETLLDAIARHCDEFPGDWGDDAGMFSAVDILNWSDDQFVFFCKEYVNPIFNRSYWNEEIEEYVDRQIDCVNVINLYLKDCGYELTPAGKIGHKQEYELKSLNGVQGVIRGIVFAAIGKPDVLFTDFLNQDTCIPENENQYLLYDEQVTTEGISWQKLQQWYETKYSKETFGKRILRSVEHCNSLIECNFYNYYLEYLEEHDSNIPALLPQVYLYYDSKNQRERELKIFEHQCMDFLFVFSENHRVVMELDGQQHYAEDEKIKLQDRLYPVQIASPSRYAAMVSAQREMTLAGYEVYRFGGNEFASSDAKEKIKAFFDGLFKKYNKI